MSHPRRRAVAVSLFLAGAAVFSAAYGHAPLYYSNQNQYFLHGMARAGVGLLDEDWLAGTADPTPAFSAAVALTTRHLHPWAFHLYHGLLLGAYAAAMLGLFAFVAGPESSARRWPAFLALFVAAHSAAARWLSYRLVGFDYPWFLQAGVAGQYLLGSMLQPSVFGVLLVVAVWLFVRGRPLLAAACTGLAADLHSTYLLPGGLLTLGFLTALLLERRARTALAAGCVALAAVLPAVVYVLVRFGPSSPAAFAESQDVLVHLRIPHHCRPDVWLDPVAGAQIAWVVLALALLRRTRLLAVLGVPLVLGALLTLVQVATDNPTLALLFPWRISALLVPVATTVILARLAALPGLPVGGPAARAASLLGVAALAAGGVWIMGNRLAFRVNDDEEPLLGYVRRHRSPGDVYLLPVRLPPPPAPHSGSLSSDFKPLEEKKHSGQIIPIDLQRFRLHTGTPIFVDFKSIPYRDVDVIGWRDRLLRARSLQERIAAGDWTGALPELRQLGITHLVTPAAGPPPGAGAEKVHEDGLYRVHRLSPAR